MSDFAAAVDIAMDESAPTGIFNVSSGTGHSIKEVYDLVRSHLQLPADPDVEGGACRRRRRPVRRAGSFQDARDPRLDSARFRFKRQFVGNFAVRRPRSERTSTVIWLHLRGEDEFLQCGATVLIVGGAGFVGSNLVKQLLEQAPAQRHHRRQPAVG